MTTKFKLAVLFLVLFCGFQSMAQTTTPVILQVYLTDQNNNPVPNYDVLIRPNALNLTDEVIVSTNSNGYWSDTVEIYEDPSEPGDWFFAIFVLDSFSLGTSSWSIRHSGPIQSPYWVLDTFKLQLTSPIKGADNCGSYQVRTDSAINNPMFIYFRNDLNKLKLGTTWVYGDGDTGHAPQSGHLYKVPGIYYYCHYTDSCGPVCDSVTVPMNGKGVGIVEENYSLNFKLYPNPASEVLSISAENGDSGITEILIYDLSGNRLCRFNDKRKLTNDEVQLDISQLVTGVYIVTIQTESGFTSTHKIVKK